MSLQRYFVHIMLVILFSLFSLENLKAQTCSGIDLISESSNWKYDDTNTNLGTSWRNPGFDDSDWPEAPGVLGYGESYINTTLSSGRITYYFRHSFSMPIDPAMIATMQLRANYDDGFVAYINGVEVTRQSLPGGTIDFNTTAGFHEDGSYQSINITAFADELVSGTNVLAVEVHNQSTSSSDIVWNASLDYTLPSVTRGPYLQSGTPGNVVVRWRTDTATDSRVSYGTGSANLSDVVDDLTSTIEHEVSLTSLTADTKYYYSVGSTTEMLSSDTDHYFVTNPTVGARKNSRIWIIGDSGTGDSDARSADSNPETGGLTSDIPKITVAESLNPISRSTTQNVSSVNETAFQDETFTFSALGDVPYSQAEVPVLQEHMDNHNLYSPSDFLIHLGDIKSASEPCVESRYQDVANILTSLAVTAFIVIGDNEWIDCSDEDQGWQFWETHLMGIDTTFCGTPFLERQNIRPENFAFIHKGVLFIGINLVGNSTPVETMRDDTTWVSQQFQEKGSLVRGAVIFAQARPTGSRALFFDHFVSTAGAFGKPVLYLHGDGHSWKHDNPFSEPNILRVQVPRGTANNPPIQVTVTLDDQNMFLFERDPWPVGTQPFNQPPCVELGPDQTIAVAEILNLNGLVTDDGVPNPPGDLTVTWSKISGPGVASFADANSVVTTASFSDPGMYTLRLTADDGELLGSNEQVIVVSGVTLAENGGGQASDAFDGSGWVASAQLFSFSLTASGEDADIGSSLTLEISTTGIVSEDFSNLQLVEDTNNNGVVDIGESAVGTIENPLNISDGIAFSSFTVPVGIIGYLLRGDVNNLVGGDELTVSLPVGNITNVTEATSGQSIIPTGSVSTATHMEPPLPVFHVERSTGNVFAHGSFIGGGADLAEHIYVSEPVEPGDVIELDPDTPEHYRKARGSSQLIAGVITTEPGFTMGNDSKKIETATNKNILNSATADRPMLTLMGRVPVKVTTENGAIQPGDLLTIANKPGYAMRCAGAKKCEGAIIGKALETLESDEGIIQVFVMVQ